MATNDMTNVQPGGHECDWVEDPPDDIKCHICHKVARDPQQHGGNKGCGKIFCTSCITAHQNNSRDCPYCQEKLNLFEDKRSASHINAQKVKCSNLNNGCSWVGELSYLEEHLSSRSCDYTRLIAKNKHTVSNKTKVAQKKFEDLITNDDPKLINDSERPRKEEPTTSYLIKLAYKLKYPVLISLLAIFLGALSLPIDSPISMKLFPGGTQMWNILNSSLTNVTNNQLHLQTKIDELANKLTKKDAELTETTAKLTTKDAELTKIIFELSNKADKNSLKTQTKLPISYKLTHFQQHKKADISFYNPPFYTSPRGYKLRMLVYANGAGDGEGTHVSVYACLMKGEHDNSLIWPFLGTVTIELLNQLEDKNHHEISIYFIDNEYSQRVMEGEGGEAGWGRPQFIPHTDLEHNPTKNCQYLKDDTLIFRISVSDPNYKSWLE